jgi:hypothetical protein
MRIAGNSSLWKSYSEGISAGPPVKESEFDLNKSPTRWPRTIVSYAAVVQKQAAKGASQQSVGRRHHYSI